VRRHSFIPARLLLVAVSNPQQFRLPQGASDQLEAISALLIYNSVFVDHSAVLVAGARAVALCLAPSQKQAGVVYNYVVGAFLGVPRLA
jgi:hypothetical protein